MKYFLFRVSGLLRALFWLRRCEHGRRIWAGGRVHVEPRGRIRIADRVQFFKGMIPTELVAEEGAEVSLGPGTLINYGLSIRAERSVKIGAKCSIGTMVVIRDSDGRGAAPVEIGEGVWLAHGAIIGPGVHIGDGAVVAAGAVVLSDVPARTLASGNPARSVPLQFFAARRSA